MMKNGGRTEGEGAREGQRGRHGRSRNRGEVKSEVGAAGVSPGWGGPVLDRRGKGAEKEQLESRT